MNAEKAGVNYSWIQRLGPATYVLACAIFGLIGALVGFTALGLVAAAASAPDGVTALSALLGGILGLCGPIYALSRRRRTHRTTTSMHQRSSQRIDPPLQVPAPQTSFSAEQTPPPETRHSDGPSWHPPTGSAGQQVTNLQTGLSTPPDRAAREGVSRDNYEDETDEPGALDLAGEKRRIIDWKRALFSFIEIPIAGTICAVMIPLILTQLFPRQPALSSFVAAILVIITIVVTPISIIIQFMGTVFDGTKGTLSYPVYAFRRSIPLRGIRAANCQNVTHKIDTSTQSNMIGEKGKTYYSKAYEVNLSGHFESRRLVFRSKYKRDQFLTYLRDYAPSCRITRWS